MTVQTRDCIMNRVALFTEVMTVGDVMCADACQDESYQLMDDLCTLIYLLSNNAEQYAIDQIKRFLQVNIEVT